jgi:H+/Cl- antiporter ClcA
MILKNRTMDPRGSMSIYPRVDLEFTKKNSLNFDMMKAEIFMNRPHDASVEISRWFLLFLIGFLTGLTAFLMAKFEEFLIDKREHVLNKVLDASSDNLGLAWLFLAGWAFLFCCIASYLTITVGPGANGSGIAEIMAYLNGVNYPKMIGVDTLVIKVVCVVVGIAGSLCIGKEGPLAHIGACIAVFCIYYIPIKHFDYFKNDVAKREFLCAGVSAGVSAAFGAPIGGTLFSYELSKPTTFWTFSMLWRCFFCCSCATFTLSFLNQAFDPSVNTFLVNSAGTLKFGQLQDISIRLDKIWGAFILGILGGILGSFFVSVNTYMTFFRKKHINTTWKKVIECALFGTATISAMTLIIIYLGNCKPI